MAADDVPNLSVALALLSILLLLIPVPVTSGSFDPPARTAPPLRGPDDYRPRPLELSELPRLRLQGAGLRAVAVVGDVGGHTATYRQDMDAAVAALQRHGVTVQRFYAGERSFSWGDVVAAATDAHFLLYMGHGIYWGGSCESPVLVGGFYFYGDQFVSPDQIRSDLGGRMARDSVVILSHVCFSAGSTACDDGGEPSQAEAQRRVRMYAAPFVDIGMEAYFANNYFNSAADFVDELLADPDYRKTVGNVFKSVYPFNWGEFRDLSYPATAGYDLWLSGSTGHWSDAFVGMPDYVFSGDTAVPELGPLPASLAFTYNAATMQLSPTDRVLTPVNVGSDAPLTWNVSRVGDWFAVSPTSGTTPPNRITITPVTAALASLPVGHHDGAVTVRVSDPADTENAVQQVDVELDVVVPRLGNLPPALSFTYFFSEKVQFPSCYRLTPRNVGSDDELSWQLDQAGDWFTASPTAGVSDSGFTVVPDEMTITGPLTYRGVITVAVTAPAGTEDAVQTIQASFHAVAGKPTYVYLPTVGRSR